MPAYFDMTLQFLRKDLYPGFVADFDAHLERSGLGFRSVMIFSIFANKSGSFSFIHSSLGAVNPAKAMLAV